MLPAAALGRLFLRLCLCACALATGFAQDSTPLLLPPVTSSKESWPSLKALETAAAIGDPAAQAQLAEQLLHGNDIPRNGPRALVLLEKAARAGEPNAAFRLGMLLDDGDHVTQDRIRALAYFRAAAVGGVAEAYHNVGAAYVGAHGIKRNYAEGLAWLILATKHGAANEAEFTVRARLRRLHHPEWIVAGEKRAEELAGELASLTVTSQLPPPAPLHYFTAQSP